jgi:molecular chaperone GrpE (heat shock protein)
MFSKLFSIFKKRPQTSEPPDPLAPVLAELHDLKKQARRQHLLLDTLKTQLTKAILDQRRPDLAPYYALADAFFYHVQTLAASTPEQLETLDMIWERLDTVLSAVGLQMLRQAGGKFDANLHAAIANQSEGADDLIVIQVVQPGYLFNNVLDR